jgi:hypothetical protein
MPVKPVDFGGFERPAAMRKPQAVAMDIAVKPVMAKAVGAEPDMDYLDIPAFLRRQMD